MGVKSSVGRGQVVQKLGWEKNHFYFHLPAKGPFPSEINVRSHSDSSKKQNITKTRGFVTIENVSKQTVRKGTSNLHIFSKIVPLSLSVCVCVCEHAHTCQNTHMEVSQREICRSPCSPSFLRDPEVEPVIQPESFFTSSAI